MSGFDIYPYGPSIGVTVIEPEQAEIEVHAVPASPPATVQLSDEAGNLAQMKSDGLFVPEDDDIGVVDLGTFA